MKKNIRISLKLFAIVVLFNIGIFAQHALTSARWGLTELSGKKAVNSKAYLEFDSSGGKFTGNAGCNRMFGAFSTKGSSIKFSGIGTTKMFCTKPGVMKAEADFTGALTRATRFAIAGDTLRIYSGRKQVLKFQRRYPIITVAPDSGIKLEDKK